MANDRSRHTPREQLVSLLGAPAQQLFNAGLRVLSMAEAQAHRIVPTASALGTMLQTAARHSARDPLGTAAVLVSAAAAGAQGVLGRIEAVVEPRMTRALNALQIPTAADLKGLARRVEELSASVRHLAASRPPAPKARGRKRAPVRKRAAGSAKSGKQS